jgi:chemotaxis protein methyltransferase CheR
MRAALSEVAAIIRREIGLEVGPSQFDALAAAIARLGDGMTPARVIHSAGSRPLLERLVDEVTVRETYFFRHLPELERIDFSRALEAANARGARTVSVWVPACASGEEAYGIAILACEHFASATPPVRVIATDVAQAALDQARRGRYAGRAIAGVGQDLRRRYFVAEADGRLSVSDRLRRLVDFRPQNLIRDPPPGGPFDVISCRNVLIYFAPKTVNRVVSSLEAGLAPGGSLLLGAADWLAASGAGASAHVSRQPRAQRRAIAPQRAAPAPKAAPAPSGDLEDALAAADRGDLELAHAITSEALRSDPLDADAHYVLGVLELARGDLEAAVVLLRRAVYIDGDFSPALFKLGRAQEGLGRLDAARQAYERTLRSLARYAREPRARLAAVDLGEIAVACHARLAAI